MPRRMRNTAKRAGAVRIAARTLNDQKVDRLGRRACALVPAISTAWGDWSPVLPRAKRGLQTFADPAYDPIIALSALIGEP
jgi:hypothetical protein